jgi:PAS domain S-box-containing protein
MKIKANISAISKNLFFGVGFVLFASLVLLINWFFTMPVKQADTINRRLVKTDQQIELLKLVQNELILRYNKAQDPFADKNSISEEQINSALTGVKKDIEYFLNFRVVKNHSELAASLSNQLSALNGFEGNLRDFVLASVERGSENSGLISRWRAMSSGILNAASANGPEVLRMAEKLKQTETAYLLNSNLKLANDILIQADEIKSKLSGKQTGVRTTDLDSYTSLTNSLIAVDKRIGSSGNLGIITNTARSLDVLLTASSNTNLLMNEVLEKRKFFWSVALYVVIALITICGIIVLILVTNSTITRPLSKTAAYLGQIAAGELPQKAADEDGLIEIQQVDHAMNELVKELKKKTDFAISLNENNLDIQLTPAGPHDELGRELNALQQKMTDTANVQKNNEEENARRRYINEGLARFAEILRTRSNDIHSLGDAFIRDIVKYLGAIQGGFFLLNENHGDNKMLDLVSSFAYNRKKFMQNSIYLGEGLVGTCAMEKQIINLTEIPEGYITITSGLGDTRPDNLLLVPVLHELELIGVLEIASLKMFKEHEIQFAEEVAGSLGATIIYTRNNQRTSELLTKSQQQALEMAEQEEEMRQNMEELKATQEESSRREEEFRGIAEAIGQSLFVIEYGLDGVIREVNDKFCVFMGLAREDITGKDHHTVLAGSLNPDAQFWDELQRSNHVTMNEKVKIARKQHQLKEHFSVILNKDGIVVRYINFITDVTT